MWVVYTKHICMVQVGHESVLWQRMPGEAKSIVQSCESSSLAGLKLCLKVLYTFTSSLSDFS